MRLLFALLLTALLPAGLTQAEAQDAVVYGATYVEVAPGAIPQGIALLKALSAACGSTHPTKPKSNSRRRSE